MADGHFKINDIKNILILFSRVKLENQSIVALDKMVEIWCKCKLEFKDVEQLILGIYYKEDRDKMDIRAFENSGFFRSAKA